MSKNETPAQPADVVIVTATGDVGSAPVTFRYTGVPSGARYVQEFIQDRLFAGAPVVVDVRQGTSACVDGLRARDESIGLQAITLHRDEISRLAGNGGVVLPLRVHMVVDATGTWEEVCARLSRREVRRYARWREDPRHTSRLSHDPEEYFWFYETMVAPSMASIYGARSRMLSASDGYRQAFKQGGLFLVEVDGEPVAGSVSEIDHDNGRITGRIIGVKDGDQFYRKNGTQNAVYHVILDWAWQHGFTLVDFGNSESFLSKGTFQYKMRFGTEVVLPPGGHSDVRTLLRWDPASCPVADFLVNNPVILADDRTGQLGAGYFRTADRPPRRDIGYLPTTRLAFERTIPLGSTSDMEHA